VIDGTVLICWASWGFRCSYPVCPLRHSQNRDGTDGSSLSSSTRQKVEDVPAKIGFIQ
jgi:hypothetical protein